MRNRTHMPVLSRAFEYWKGVDAKTGRHIDDKMHSESAAKPAEGMGAR